MTRKDLKLLKKTSLKEEAYSVNSINKNYMNGSRRVIYKKQNSQKKAKEKNTKQFAKKGEEKPGLKDVVCIQYLGNHYAFWRRCRALNAMCSLCNQKGHFTRACKNKKPEFNKKDKNERSMNLIEFEGTNNVVLSIDNDDLIYETLVFGDQSFSFLLDCGAAVNIISKKTLEQIQGSDKIELYQ